jgi:hypothetical protein
MSTSAFDRTAKGVGRQHRQVVDELEGSNSRSSATREMHGKPTVAAQIAVRELLQEGLGRSFVRLGNSE